MTLTPALMQTLPSATLESISLMLNMVSTPPKCITVFDLPNNQQELAPENKDYTFYLSYLLSNGDQRYVLGGENEDAICICSYALKRAGVANAALMQGSDYVYDVLSTTPSVGGVFFDAEALYEMRASGLSPEWFVESLSSRYPDGLPSYVSVCNSVVSCKELDLSEARRAACLGACRDNAIAHELFDGNFFHEHATRWYTFSDDDREHFQIFLSSCFASVHLKLVTGVYYLQAD